MSTMLFDCQHDNTNLTNSVVFHRTSTSNDLGYVIFANDISLEDEIYLGLDEDDYDLVCCIGELGWNDVFVDNNGQQIL